MRLFKRLTLVAFLLSLILPGKLYAQGVPTPDENLLSGFDWRYVGPAIAGGRITDVEIVLDDPSHWFIGAASGGVFESRNRGVTWEPIFDDAPNLSIGDIALAPSDPLEIWIGTGEANNRNSSPWGAGVFHSSDGGKTWVLKGLEDTRHIGKVIIHPTDPETVWVAAVGHLWGPNSERGVYKTTDRGTTWTKSLYLDSNTGVIDIALHPSDPNVLYAATYTRRRRAWGFLGGGPNGGIYRSLDGGESWDRMSEGLPEGDIGRIGFEVWQRDPNVVVAIIEAEDGGVFRSGDRGETWERINTLNPRPMYYSQIRLDPNDQDRMYVLGTNLHRSVDGGETFEVMPMELEYNTGVHVDHHDLWIDPSDSRHMVLGNDGGLYYTYDSGDNWQFTGNLPIQQLYDISLNMEDPYQIIGGLQDNNHYMGPSTTRRYHGVLNHDWRVIDYGDGMTSQADPIDPTTVYVSSQGGAILRVDTRTLDRKDIQPFNPDTANAFRFYWTAPIHMSPHDPSTLYLGANRLFISRNRGESWDMTEDLTKAIPQDDLEVMGVLTDSTTLSRNDGVGTYGSITSISESPAESGIIWVGADDGTVQVSRDHGESWSDISGNISGLPNQMFVSRVEASAAYPGRAYVTFDGHWDDDYGPYLYVTEDFGDSWTSLVADLRSSTINVVREHPGNSNLLFVGAEDGVFVSTDRGKSWSRLNNNMPWAPVDDLEIHPRDNDLVAGTHGRGVWILDNVWALSDMREVTDPQEAKLLPVIPATLFQPNVDVPSQGQGIYQAANRPFGAILDYWLDRPVDGGVQIGIQDSDGTLVRVVQGSGSVGLNRIVWDLRHQPIPHDTIIFDVPSLDVGPRGPLVLPGNYRAYFMGALEHIGESGTTAVEVLWDQLNPVSEVQARYDFTMKLYALQQLGYHAQVQAGQLEKSAQEAVDQFLEEQELEEDADLNVLVVELEDVTNALRGRNSDLRGWWRGLIGEFDGGPSVIGSMTGPNESQRQRLMWTQQQFENAIGDLDQAIEGVIPDLNRILAGAEISPVGVPIRGVGLN